MRKTTFLPAKFITDYCHFCGYRYVNARMTLELKSSMLLPVTGWHFCAYVSDGVPPHFDSGLFADSGPAVCADYSDIQWQPHT
ncbi:hypothetical protein Y032_0212g2230 [Ancylostoma ceylanicum]|uniref:Uncharacterized protein n=1 Tax=Ancylostoma ceylanicum TaxID=53326 RepID=A0A016SKM7_9BILA|nr:hypothetical protein Y032_0212g2230 [Ancylostoma ceylanicum]